MTSYDPQSGRDLPPGEELTQAQTESDDHDVTAAVQGLSGLVSGVEDLQDVLGQIATFAVAAVPTA